MDEASNSYRYHATQVNVQGSATLAHNYTVYSHPSTFSVGFKVRNSYSTQRQASQDLVLCADNASRTPFTLASVAGNYTNPTYNKSFAINGQAYGPTLSLWQRSGRACRKLRILTQPRIRRPPMQAFFNADERISAGYIEDVIFFGKYRLQGGVRFDNGATHFLANQITFDSNGNPVIVPIRKDASYFNALPSVALQYQCKKTRTCVRSIAAGWPRQRR